MSKCAGKCSYTGIDFYSNVRVDHCVVQHDPPASQVVSSENYSLLTYRVDFRSSCDQHHLMYLQVGNESPDVWEGFFHVPFSWRGKGEASTSTAIAARQDNSNAINCEIDVVLTAWAQPYAPVGPLSLLLRVDM